MTVERTTHRMLGNGRRLLMLAGIAILLLLLLFLNPEGEDQAPPPSPPGPDGTALGGTASVPSAPQEGTPIPVPSAEPAEEPPAEPGITLTVTVKDATGHPVAGATVFVLPHEVYLDNGWDGALALPPPATYRAETDAEGRVEFEHPKKFLYGVHLFAFRRGQDDGAVSKAYYWRKPGRHAADLTLVRGHAVRGRVVDADGRRIEDAKVSLIIHDMFTSMISSVGPYGLRLDPLRLEHGEFEFPTVPESEDMILSLVAAEAEGYLPAQFEFAFGEEHPDEVVVRMLRPVRVIGRVVDAEGRPFAGATVRRFSDGEPARVTTGEDGTFAFENAPEDGEVVSVATPSGVPFRVSVGRVRGREGDLGDLKVSMGKMIEGVVVDDDGAPVAGISVSLYLKGLPESYRSTTSGPDGRFSLPDLGEGEHTVAAYEGATRGWDGRQGGVHGLKSGAKGIRVVLSAGMLLRIYVKFPPGQEPGADPAYLHIQLDRVGTLDEPFMQEFWDRGRYSFRTRVRKQGTFTLSVSMAGYRQAREQVEVTAERESSITVTLEKN